MGLPVEEIAVRLPYTPRRWARAFHNAMVRYYCLVIHRRIGKTVATLNQHQLYATNDGLERRRLLKLAPSLSEAAIKELLRGRVYGHVMPTRVQAKLTAWDKLKYYADRVPGHLVNESELRIDYPNGSRLQLFGADNPDSLRGPAFSGLSFDEYGIMPPNIFSEVMSKNLADHLGYAIFVGTIKGKNQLYKTYKGGQGDPEWFTIWQDLNQSLRTESEDTALILRTALNDDIKLIPKGLMSQEEIDQEWYLSIDAATKGAYYAKQLAKARREGRIGRCAYDPMLPVHDVWDLGTGLQLVVGCVQRVQREIRLINVVTGAEGEGIPQMVATLQRLPYVWGKHLAPHDVQATDMGTGKTRLETAKGLNWPFTMVPDIGLIQGIDAGRLAFARLWVDETACDDWLQAMGIYRRNVNEKTGVISDQPVHDWSSHYADMWRYAAVGENLMTNERPRVTATLQPNRQREPGGQGWMR